MGETAATPLVNAMSADQQAYLFRALPTELHGRFMAPLDEETRHALTLLLRYSPYTAGGIMTTEFVSMPMTWTVQQALDYIAQVGRTKETIYAIYCLDPDTHALAHVVSLRDLVVAPDRAQPVAITGTRRRAPLTVTPATDREDVARLISKYNVLAVPVIDEDHHLLGIVTVDDVIDALVREQTDDVQKFGGMEALDEPYIEIRFGGMIKKRAPWLMTPSAAPRSGCTPSWRHRDHA